MALVSPGRYKKLSLERTWKIGSLSCLTFERNWTQKAERDTSQVFDALTRIRELMSRKSGEMPSEYGMRHDGKDGEISVKYWGKSLFQFRIDNKCSEQTQLN